LNRLIHHLLVFYISLPETHIDNLSTVVSCIADRVGHVLIALIAIRDHAHAHDRYMIRDTLHAQAIISYRSDDARNMCTVACIRTFHVRVPIVRLATVRIIVPDNPPSIAAHTQVVVHLTIVIVISVLEILITVLKRHTIFPGRLHDAQGSRLLLISGIVLIYLIAGRTVGTECNAHAVQYLF